VSPPVVGAARVPGYRVIPRPARSRVGIHPVNTVVDTIDSGKGAPRVMDVGSGG
jgi:hypothetical protein